MLRVGVDRLLDADLTALSGVEVAELLAALEVQRRRLDAVDVAVLAEADCRGVAGEYAQTGTPELVMTLCRVDPAESRRRTEAARTLGPRRTVTGEPLPPILAASADALRAGAVSATQVDVVTRCLGRLERVPDLPMAEVAPVVERVLLDAAQHEHPGLLARTAQAIITRLDPDGVEPNDEQAQRRRDFGLRKHPDGTSTPTGRFTPDATATIEAILDSLSAPIPAGEDGIPDDRTAGQRRHDALLDALKRLLRSGTLPDAGAAPVTVIVTVKQGVARTGHGDTWTMPDVLRYLDCAEIITVVENDLDGVIAYGRTKRLATPGQRRALAARDGGCSFPACTRPAAWCEAHHVIPWIDGGNTDLINLCLVCPFHHGVFEKAGWRVDMINGHPWWTPPPWIDPARKPRRNTAHHPPDLDFTSEDRPRVYSVMQLRDGRCRPRRHSAGPTASVAGPMPALVGVTLRGRGRSRPG